MSFIVNSKPYKKKYIYYMLSVFIHNALCLISFGTSLNNLLCFSQYSHWSLMKLHQYLNNFDVQVSKVNLLPRNLHDLLCFSKNSHWSPINLHNILQNLWCYHPYCYWSPIILHKNLKRIYVAVCIVIGFEFICLKI